MRLKLPKALLEFTGNAYLHKYPLWFTYRPQHHKVSGKEVRQILNVLQAGDILLRRFDGYVNTLFTPGFWAHAALASSCNSVIHAVSAGVVEEDILEFSRCDSLAILRVVNDKSPEFDSRAGKAVDIANKFREQNFQYDYAFERGNKKLYCTELVDSCYEGLFSDEYTLEMGNNLLTPEHIFTSEHVRVIADIKH